MSGKKNLLHLSKPKAVRIPTEIAEKAKKIKAIIFDVDGVLTDGRIIYNNEGMESKEFNVKDGQIIQHLKLHEILTGVITGRDSQVVRNRCNELKFDFHYHGVKRKGEKFEDILMEFGLNADEVAFIGDDIIDLPVLTQCGLAATPADGHYKVKEHVDLVLQAKGGEGALRELADLVLESQGFYELIIERQLRNE
ncbi:3-deoxy-D-manno-octulosonate 8-phosphate phosphatase (KDO 8-P phosphatase) [Roseivirga ehrenbergii]|uniref:3-deoxy-D-manno-octulosonate 8-phosphate phosphatase KdsC n=1 Tax=Roseivirga ehrenbergii (strain DSM 102268 / JCM 13514 / KCTC 12282 / NCIMB 14502 / KMM 6017) TaxID=279360 RepID=A0A150XEA2_ROSEK|nr:HAD hydrolase family protein [Roseivirga ehrenbergii]KYG77031.1 3-deoxy-manno-octulosonate-8-phosphatase [Roseivirga ehrenbergii]TCL14468.1 3-deoxy-D-manno-octulosonate 8-phosphate phosphatase (KDO 8-P phosphatase) [Roseivirga ehrenbergii]